MEPMSLGSPVGSSPPVQPSPQQPHYLPPFLMGDASPATQQPQVGARGFPLSPSKSDLQASSQTLLLLRTPKTPQGHSPRGTPMGEKHHHHGGPPTKSLFQSGRPSPIIPNSVSTPPHQYFSPQPTYAQGTTLDSTPNVDLTKDATSLDYSRLSESTGATTTPWVTVFGFPPSAASFVLQQFGGYGTIVERRPGAAPGANWMHLRYATPLQAHRALSKNGRVFGGSVMVGVMPFHPQGAPDDSQKENVFPSWRRVGSPLDTSAILDDGSPASGIRPLTQAYEVTRAEHEVVQKAHTPRKSTSVVSKAMEYVFGW